MNVSIAELSLAPGKSMRAIEEVETFRFDEYGMFGDREYMWVEAEPHTYANYKQGREVPSGHFLSQREDPPLTGIIPGPMTYGLELKWQQESTGLFVPRAEM